MSSSDSKIKCEMCHLKESKYKCPGCFVRTCSSICVSQHKVEHHCSGLRDRTTMVNKGDMNNLTLLNDYRFLEEIEHKIDDGYRHPLRYFINRRGEELKAELPPHMKRLKSEAMRRSTIIDYLPQHFSRRQTNSTRYIYSEKIIRWHVKFVFPQAGVSFYQEQVDENKRLTELVREYIVPTPQQLPEGDEKLKFYQAATFSGISILLKSEMSKAAQFHEMFMSKSLKQNLANHKIIEYPIFYVVLKSHLESFLEYSNDDDTSDLFTEDIEEDSSIKHVNVTNPFEENQSCKVQLSKHTGPHVKKRDFSFFNASSSDED